MKVKQWLYQNGRPNRVASVLNRGWAVIHALGVAPNYLVTLEVQGRHSGRTISLPLVMVVINGERYLVSMLRTEASWVRNVKAADGRATLRHGWREEVQLEEVAVDQCAPILKAYLHRAQARQVYERLALQLTALNIKSALLNQPIEVA